jgi:hypothetical protein
MNLHYRAYNSAETLAVVNLQGRSTNRTIEQEEEKYKYNRSRLALKGPESFDDDYFNERRRLSSPDTSLPYHEGQKIWSTGLIHFVSLCHGLHFFATVLLQ